MADSSYSSVPPVPARDCRGLIGVAKSWTGTAAAIERRLSMGDELALPDFAQKAQEAALARRIFDGTTDGDYLFDG